MRATAVIPVKRFGAAKQRLEVADPALRERLAEAMLADVLAALGRAQELERIIVVSGEPRAHRLAEQAGAEKLDDPLDAGHSEAALAGIAAAIERGAACVALLPGDCPFSTPLSSTLRWRRSWPPRSSSRPTATGPVPTASC